MPSTRNAIKRRTVAKRQALPEEYIVAKVLERRIRGDVIEYRILWEGYPEAEATWEPRANLMGNIVVGAYEFELDRTQEHHVKKVLEKRTADDGTVEYLIQWTGYEESESSWESKKNVEHNKKVVEFEKKLEKTNMIYRVRKILDKKTTKGKVLYRVLWDGFSRADSTWEPEEHMFCPELIEEYEREYGGNTDDATAAAPADDVPVDAPAAQDDVTAPSTSQDGRLISDSDSEDDDSEEPISDEEAGPSDSMVPDAPSEQMVPIDEDAPMDHIDDVDFDAPAEEVANLYMDAEIPFEATEQILMAPMNPVMVETIAVSMDAEETPMDQESQASPSNLMDLMGPITPADWIDDYSSQAPSQPYPTDHPAQDEPIEQVDPSDQMAPTHPEDQEDPDNPDDSTDSLIRGLMLDPADLAILLNEPDILLEEIGGIDIMAPIAPADQNPLADDSMHVDMATSSGQVDPAEPVALADPADHIDSQMNQESQAGPSVGPMAPSGLMDFEAFEAMFQDHEPPIEQGPPRIPQHLMDQLDPYALAVLTLPPDWLDNPFPEADAPEDQMPQEEPIVHPIAEMAPVLDAPVEQLAQEEPILQVDPIVEDVPAQIALAQADSVAPLAQNAPAEQPATRAEPIAAVPQLPRITADKWVYPAMPRIPKAYKPPAKKLRRTAPPTDKLAGKGLMSILSSTEITNGTVYLCRVNEGVRMLVPGEELQKRYPNELAKYLESKGLSNHHAHSSPDAQMSTFPN